MLRIVQYNADWVYLTKWNCVYYRYCSDANVYTYCAMTVSTGRLYPFIVYVFDDPVILYHLTLYNWWLSLYFITQVLDCLIVTILSSPTVFLWLVFVNLRVQVQIGPRMGTEIWKVVSSEKLTWVETGIKRWVWASDRGAGQRFIVKVSLHLVFSLFPFPVSTTQFSTIQFSSDHGHSRTYTRSTSPLCTRLVMSA